LKKPKVKEQSPNLRKRMSFHKKWIPKSASKTKLVNKTQGKIIFTFYIGVDSRLDLIII